METTRRLLETGNLRDGSVSRLSAVVQIMAAVALAIVVLFGAGFSPAEVVHNAAHDARHSAGFPCH